MLALWFIASVLVTVATIMVYRRKTMPVAICVVLIFTAVALWDAPLYYEFPLGGEVLTFEGNTVIHHPHGTFCWEFGNSYVNAPSVPVPISGGLTLMTENPKVRKFNYSLTVKIISVDKFYAEPERRYAAYGDGEGHAFDMHGNYDGELTGEGVIAKVVSSALFKFNSANSKKLAEFDDPLDGQQRADLKQFIESTLNPKLEKAGLAIEFQSFSIE